MPTLQRCHIGYANGSRYPSVVAILRQMSACVGEVASWMRCNRLQLNTAKTKVQWCATSRRQHQTDPTGSHTRRQRYCSDCRLMCKWPGNSYLDWGLHKDSRFYNCVELLQCTSIHPVNSICHALGPPVTSRVTAAVCTRLQQSDPRRSAWSWVEQTPDTVLNAAARLIFSMSKYEQVILLVRDLHWLRKPEQIEYNITVLVYWCLHGLALRTCT